VALKDAAGSVDLTSDVMAATRGSGLAVLSGDDPLTLPMMAVGAVGVVSVLSNVAPAALVRLVAAANAGDVATARALHYELLDLAKTLFVEVNPVPAKRALELMGACVHACVCACVRACVCACVCACVRACARVESDAMCAAPSLAPERHRLTPPDELCRPL